MKNKGNYQYLKMALILSGDISLNPQLVYVNRHHNIVGRGFLPPLLWKPPLYCLSTPFQILSITLNNSLILKIYFPQCLFFSKITDVEVMYLLIRFSKTKFFLWNTNSTDRNDINKQNTHVHTKHPEKDDTG